MAPACKWLASSTRVFAVPFSRARREPISTMASTPTREGRDILCEARPALERTAPLDVAAWMQPAKGRHTLSTDRQSAAVHWKGDEPFLVVNADIYTDMPVPGVELADSHLGHLVMVPTPDYREHGDFDIDEGLVRNGERPAYTFSGMAIYRPELFDGCDAGRFPLAPILREAADNRQLSGSLYEGPWADIGTPERLAELSHKFATVP